MATKKVFRHNSGATNFEKPTQSPINESGNCNKENQPQKSPGSYQLVGRLWKLSNVVIEMSQLLLDNINFPDLKDFQTFRNFLPEKEKLQGHE